MMLTNNQRYWDKLQAIAQFTDPALPYTRRSFSDLFVQARAWLTQEMQQAGLSTYVDPAGNLIGYLKGSNPDAKAIAIGSHSDTVPAGGRFDGVAGVIAGLECAYAIQEHKLVLKHGLQIIDYLAEEPSEWGISCIGSRGISGYLSAEQIQTPHPTTGETLGAAIDRIGGDSANLTINQDLAAALEIHIEQGLQLEAEQLDIGVVTGIVGISRINVIFKGQADHAGMTPMHLRANSILASAKLITFAEEKAQEFSQLQQGYFVATCGQIINHPNATNVISGSTKVVFDIRSENQDLIDRFIDQLKSAAQEYASATKVELEFALVSTNAPVLCDPTIIDSFEQSSNQLGYKSMKMASGAGHDTSFLSRIAPSGMIFVPSKDGISHNPAEWTSPEEIGKGVECLLQTLIQLDKQL